LNYINLSQMANPSFQHTINQSAVFHYLREHGPTYKKHIAQALGISLPSVTRALNALIERGFAEHTEYRKNKQSRTVPYYQITIQNAIIIAIDVLKGLISGRNLVEMFPIHEIGFDPSIPLIDDFTRNIQRYVEDCLGRNIDDVKFICIGLPGIVNVDTGVVEKAIYHPNLENIPIKEPLGANFHCKVFIDNVVNLAAFANYCEFHKQYGNMVACDIGMEIGTGLIINHRVYRGQNNIAGETGFFIGDLDHPERTCKMTCTFRPLNREIIKSGLIDDHEDAGSPGEDEKTCLRNVARLFDCAYEGNAAARELLKDYITKIILMLNKVEILLNPKKIVIGGDVCCLPHSREVFLKPLNELYGPVRQMDDPVCYSNYDVHVSLYGACEMGLETYLSEEFPYMFKESPSLTG